MAMAIRAKQAAAPLSERVKARFGYSGTSGSEYGGEEAEAHTSSCLSALVYGFFEPDEPSQKDVNESDGDNDNEDDDGDSRSARLVEAVQDLLDPFKKSDYPLRIRLYSEVIKASEALASLRPSASGYRRAVMNRLRDLRYNAGICKSRWEGRGGLTAGSYEYIDIVAGENQRYIVDLDFAAQFEVARATTEYQKLMSLLPRIMVGQPQELREMMRTIGEAARRSLKSRDLSVPPWRKSRYMLAKWLGPYRRTINPSPSAVGAAVAGGGEAKCRTIGFKMAPAAITLFH